jgi:hypothetical protein
MMRKLLGASATMPPDQVHAALQAAMAKLAACD